jgi:hypothetical protein
MNTLIMGDTTFSLPVWLLTQQCESFAADPTLLNSPYHVESLVRLEVVQL